MRIAHIVRRYSKVEWGGTETVVAHTVEEQLARGHEPRVFATCALQNQDPAVSLPPHAEVFDYVYPYWPMPSGDKLALDKKGGSPYAPTLFRAVRAFRPDLIHIHAGGRLAVAAVRLASDLGVPSVMSLHGGAAVVPQGEIDEMLRPLRHKFPYGGLLDRFLGWRFDPLSCVGAIVCISRAEEVRLGSLYPGRRVRYVPNGVALAPRVMRSVGSRPRNILCVSRIDYQKNQVALVEALGHLPSDCRLTLVGPITAAWYGEKIRSRAQELGVAERLTLVPGLPPGSAELEAAFAAADVFVLPSVHEPFGIVALEAMQRGLPLVSSNVGGLRDIVTDGVNGLLFEPSNVRALASAVTRLFADPAMAGRLVEGGFATAANYTWPKVIDRLEDVYAELLQDRQHGRASS